MSKSKVLSPKAWYLVGAGAVALALDGGRRVIKRRRQAATTAQVEAEAAIVAPVAVREPTVAKPKPAKAPAATRKASPTGDDLTEIKGIGPTFAGRLAEAGITTFADLAAASPERLREVTHANATASPEEWIAQARGR